MRVLHKNCKELIELMERVGNVLTDNNGNKYFHLPLLYKKEGEDLIEVPLSDIPPTVYREIKTDKA